MSDDRTTRMTLHTRHDDLTDWNDWRDADRQSTTDLPYTFGDAFIRVTELRKTLEAMREPIAAVSWTVTSTSLVPALSGDPSLYRAMLFVAGE